MSERLIGQREPWWLSELEAERALADRLHATLMKVNAGPDSLGLMEEVQIADTLYKQARGRE